MNKLITREELKHFILNSFSISEREFDRLLDEIHAFYELEVHEFIQQRHFQLKKEGLNNSTIYSLIQDEMDQRRFKAGKMSIRQIRRAIYG
ncbi:hypothetical protein KJ966_15195 [bacterium]|nr:hypothetical protein [bacterium]